MSDIYTWDEVVNSGEIDGYESYFNHIDAEVCREIPCENCESSEIQYHGYIKEGLHGRSYRAFAECTNCGNVIEF